MAKTKEQLLNVRVVTQGSTRDEVAIQSAEWKEPKEGEPPEPYINRMVYAKPGLFKDGKFSESEVAKIEEKSNKVLADEFAALVAKEEAEAKEKAAAAVEPAKKTKEG